MKHKISAILSLLLSLTLMGCDICVGNCGDITSGGNHSSTGESTGEPTTTSDAIGSSSTSSADTGVDEESGLPEDTEGPECSFLTLGTLPCEEDGLFWSDSPLCFSDPYSAGDTDNRASEKLPLAFPTATIDYSGGWQFNGLDGVSDYAILTEQHQEIQGFWYYHPENIPFAEPYDEMWLWTIVSAPSLSKDQVAAYYVDILGDTVFSIDSEVVTLGCGLFAAKALFPVPEVGDFLSIYWNMPHDVVSYVVVDPRGLSAQVLVDGSEVIDGNHVALLSGGGVIIAY